MLELNRTERMVFLLVSVTVAIYGLFMSGLAIDRKYEFHGIIVMLFGTLLSFVAIAQFHARYQPSHSLEKYFDSPTRIGIIIAMTWGVVGMVVGDWVAWLLAFPDISPDYAWASFGRIRPAHTTGIIFGFGGNALIATSFHVMQRTCRTRIADNLSPWIVLAGYNLFCVLAVSGYFFGVTQSKEYAEPEWYADILLVIVWIIYFALYLRTLARRREPHIYVANWYYLAFILVVAMLHIVNNLALPIALNHSKSYSLFSGVQDALTEWWYGHNAVAFFLTAGFLGMLYYFLPKRADRPIYSYRMSIIGFWGITFFYMWVGSHHLHYTALPQWVQTLGMTFSLMLLIPSWVSTFNALLTLNGAWHKVRDDATLRFMMVATVFYGLTTFEGSFMAIRSVNSLSHYTDWTVAHVHAGALGWVAMVTFGAFYYLVPLLWNKKGMYSNRLIEVHFWLALSGILLYVISMWNSGVIQGVMWRTYNENGTLTYPFIQTVAAMHPYYIARAVGGLLFLSGFLCGFYNIIRTIRMRSEASMPTPFAAHELQPEI